MKMRMISIVILSAVVLLAGCVGQQSSSSGGVSSLDTRIIVDPLSIMSDETANLYVDFKNDDNVPFVYVFVEAFDLGPLQALRSPTTPPVQGTIPISSPTFAQSCRTSGDCADESYGGCGVCSLSSFTSEEGVCISGSSTKGEGWPCDKQCECSPGFTCTYMSSLEMRVCHAVQRTCTDGSPLNTCGIETYCSPWGEIMSACAGPDKIPYDRFEAGTGGGVFVDDCSCPGDKVCKGDGTCGDPRLCFTTVYGLNPGEIGALECDLRLASAGIQSLIKETNTFNINVRTVFRKRLAETVVIELISNQERQRRETLGRLVKGQQTYTISDKNVVMNVDFDSAPPFVAGQRIVAHINIHSTGNGRIYRLEPSDFTIAQPLAREGVRMECGFDSPLLSDKGVFPSITCVMDVPKDMVDFLSYPLGFNLYYDYEIRDTVQISVSKI